MDQPKPRVLVADGKVWWAIIDLHPWARQLSTAPSDHAAMKSRINLLPYRLRSVVSEWVKNNVPKDHLSVKKFRKHGEAGELGYRHRYLAVSSEHVRDVLQYIQIKAEGGDYRARWSRLPDSRTAA
ncbi:hypothetical protein [Brucella pituitosa]|uniref:hypothetical protein n=1 Tax=Brucella pituitosa TaxID=571256 RepID=UPI0009A22DB8|nr:hypothetical protein [Brucella pituitosa]